MARRRHEKKTKDALELAGTSPGQVDAVAIAAGTWVINPEQILGVHLPGRLPLEEAVFFLVTNILIGSGVTLALAVLTNFSLVFLLLSLSLLVVLHPAVHQPDARAGKQIGPHTLDLDRCRFVEPLTRTDRLRMLGRLLRYLLRREEHPRTVSRARLGHFLLAYEQTLGGDCRPSERG